VVLINVLLYWSQMVLKKNICNFQEKLIYSIYFTR